MQHHGREEQHHEDPLAIAALDQEKVERCHGQQGKEGADETAARGATRGVREQAFVARDALPTFAQRQDVPLQRTPIIIDIGQHQETVEREGDEGQGRLEGLVLEDHGPVDRADADRHHHAQRRRDEDAPEDQRSRHQLNHHGDVEEPAVEEGRHQLDGEPPCPVGSA